MCGCGAYWFPHRWGSGACHNGPRAEYYAALRADEPEAAALLWSDKLEAMMKSIPGIEATELPEPDSDFAMLEHFGQALVPTDRNPNVRPMPSEVPDFGLQETEWSELGKQAHKWGPR